MPGTDGETFEGWPLAHTDYRVERPIFQHYALLNAEWHKRIPDYEIATTGPLMERGSQLSLRTLPLRWPASPDQPEE